MRPFCTLRGRPCAPGTAPGGAILTTCARVGDSALPCLHSSCSCACVLWCHHRTAGTGTSDECPADKKQPKGTVCDARATNPCVVGGRCDGQSNSCPAPKKAPTGTPCRKDGLYEEALDDKGRVAFKGHYSAAKAEAHGWATCNRCYEGECQEFKWEIWGEEGDYVPEKPKEDKPDDKPDDKPSKPKDKPVQKPDDKPSKPDDKPSKPDNKPDDKPSKPDNKPSKPDNKPDNKPKYDDDKDEDKPKPKPKSKSVYKKKRSYKNSSKKVCKAAAGPAS